MTSLDPTAALLVIDMQLGFDDPAWGKRNNPGAELCIAMLLDAWRQHGSTVVHVHHHSMDPSGHFKPGTPGCRPKPEAMPLPEEPVYHKRVNGAFIGTSLEADLRERGIDTVVIAGLSTNHCISTTVRMAGNLGFRTYVVADATAAFARAAADGRWRSAEEVHDGALGDLQQEFAELIDTAAAIAALTRAHERAPRRASSDLQKS
ncbi:MAG TPA: cysteine hydrolase family protein [Steroidobacteraceae bacterium]